MTMKVMNNKGAQITAGELNKNDSNLQKALSKVSTGQKIVGADDDSSGYSISERMRMKIRALNQDDQNVQNGSSMIRTAERGVDRIVQTLRTMKELAIDAANDSNTDEDRATIQKELDQCIATIDDIAIGTEFNGKILLDGRWAKGGLFIPVSGGGGANTTAENVISGFREGYNAVEVAAGTNGGSGDWQFNADRQFSTTNGGKFFVELDFSAMTLNGSYPDALTGQGFTILCAGCPQYVNIIFDANKTSTQSTFNNTAGVAEDGTTNSYAREYVIGVKGVNNAKALSNAIYEGIAALKGKNADGVLVDSNHKLSIEQDSSGRVFLTKNGLPDMQFLEGTIPNPLTVPIEPVEVEVKQANPLWIQAGTQSGQRTHIFIEDMRTEALGINNADVTTQAKANDTIAVINSAIEIALEEATNLGSYLNRMESTAINITTMNDNVQASESTIRDADMAKEMVNYTKSGLLKQSSQTMFAQANQNGEAVLGLLE